MSTPGLGGLGSLSPGELTAVRTPAIDERAIAAEALQTLPVAVVVDAVLGTANEEALDSSQARDFLTEIRAEKRGRGLLKQWTRSGPQVQGIQSKRLVVTYRTESSMNQFERMDESVLTATLKKKAPA